MTRDEYRNMVAGEIEANVYCALRQFGGEMAVFSNGETEWVSTLKREFGDNYDSYVENADMITVSWEDYQNQQSEDIRGWIYSVLN